MSSCQTSNLNLKEKHNKIRKRGCSSSFTTSSYSSSSPVRRYRFKRAILVGKRGGSGTPAPVWKTRTSSPSMATHHNHHHDQHAKEALPCSGYGVPSSKEKELYVSARKLAATLWEINDLPPSRVKKEIEAEPTKSSKERSVSLCRSGLLRPRMSDPSYSPLSEGMKVFEDDSCKRRVSALSNQLQVADYSLEDLDAHASAKIIEARNQTRNKQNCGKCPVGFKNRLKEARSGVSTSKKLLKVLNQMCLQEQHSSSIPLILAMSGELDRVRHQIDQLIQEQNSNQNDIEYLMKHFAEEKNSWKRRERERIRDAVASIAQELQVEKKLRRQTERLNKKISKEMANAKASYLKVSRDLESEKRAKEILQQICDQLARGMGEDRAQVEKLKRESAEVREEVEKERAMLQLADVLREERVQMKLSEAKYQFEEKNAVLEKLRNELEGFFRTKEDENGDVNVEFKKIKDLESYLSTACQEFENPEKENGLDVGDGVGHEDDSADSDLQSIELNMDNDNKSYKWSFAFENVAQGESKRVSIDKDIGRKSFSERIQWGSICFNKGAASCKKKDFGMNIHESSDQFDRERSIEFLVGAQIQDEESESYRPIMTLRECLSCAIPAQASGQPLTLQHVDVEAEENTLALEGHILKQEAAGRESIC